MATSHGNSSLSEAVDLVMKYTRGVSEDTVGKTLDDLGIECVQDLCTLDPAVHLTGLLKPVQAIKLKQFLQKNISKESSTAHLCPSLSASNSSSSSDAESFQVPYQKLSTEVMGKLEKGIVLLRNDRLELKNVILRDLLAITRNPGKALLSRIAKNVCIEKFPKSMGDKIGAGHESFLSQLKWAAENMNRKRKVLGDLQHGRDEQAPAKRMKAKDRYGCVEEQFSPLSFPQGETPDTQEAKRLWLKEQSALVRTERDLRGIAEKMSETYASQRYLIAGSHLKVADVVQSWPFLSEVTHLRRHFERLTGVCFTDAHSAMREHAPNLLKYVRADTEARSRGKLSAARKDVFQRLVLTQRRHEKSRKTLEDDFVCVSLCLIDMMGQKGSALFQVFPDHTSVDEVLAATNISTPHIAVLGDDVQSAEKCFVLVEGCALEEMTSVYEAIFLAFAAYFVYAIAYPKEIAAYLQFIEKVLFKIDGSGSKVERTKAAVPHIESRLRSEMLRFNTYCATWGLQGDQSTELRDAVEGRSPNHLV